MKASDYCTVTTTTDNKENAERITQTLLQEKLVACVQSSTIESAYRWKGKIIHSQEIKLDFKTRVALFPKVKEIIEALHTYDVPEILMIRMDDGKFDYLRWIAQETDRKEYCESADGTLLQKLEN